MSDVLIPDADKSVINQWEGYFLVRITDLRAYSKETTCEHEFQETICEHEF